MAETSCNPVEVPSLSPGPARNLQLASIADATKSLGFDGAMTWNSLGRTVLCSSGSHPVDTATNRDPLPTSPNLPWCSPSSIIPEFKPLVTPPPRRNASTRPLQVYSHRRLRRHLRETLLLPLWQVLRYWRQALCSGGWPVFWWGFSLTPSWARSISFGCRRGSLFGDSVGGWTTLGSYPSHRAW